MELSKQYRYIPIIFFFIAVFDNVAVTFGVTNFAFRSIINRFLQVGEIYFIYLTFVYVKRNFGTLKKQNKFLLFFFIYCTLYFIYGLYKIMFTTDTLYTQAAIASCMGLMQVGMVFFFKYDEVVFKFSRFWLDKMIFVFVFFMLPFVNFFNWEIIFVPAALYLLFWNCLSKKHKFLVMAMIVWCFMYNGQRSQVARILLFAMIVISSKFFLFKKSILRIANSVLYAIPIVLFTLASLGIFNIFSDSSQLTGSEDIEVAGESLSEDTRTSLFVEAINGAIDEGYMFYGKSPASGYYSPHFEKAKNTVGFTRLAEVFVINIFTWCGVPGLFLFMCLYMFISFRCLEKSNNRYMKCVAIAISVSWFIDWYANSNYAMGVYHTIIYFMMGMALNDKFLQMNDLEFKQYFKSRLYEKKYKRIY